METRESAAISDTLLPVARAVRKRAFISRFLLLAVAVVNCGCSNIDNTLLGFQVGRILCCGGFSINCEMASREKLTILGVNIEGVQ